VSAGQAEADLTLGLKNGRPTPMTELCR